MLTPNSSAQISPRMPDGVDRRKQPRVDVLSGGRGELVLAKLAGCAGGLILDVGAGGMSVQVAGPVPSSSEFNVEFNLCQATSAIQAKARPAWRGDDGKLGICFVDLTDEACHQLTQWLNGNVPQGETTIVCQEAAAEPLTAAAHDRLEPKEQGCLASKVARAYSALPPEQRTATRCPGSDVQTLSSLGRNSFQTRFEAHQEMELSKQHKSSIEIPRQELERQTQQKKPLEEVRQEAAGESKTRSAKGEQQDLLDRHSCGLASPPQLEKRRFTRGSSDEVNTLRDVVAQACQTTNADGVALALAEPSGGIVCRASLGKAPKPGDLLKVDSGLLGECIRTGRVVACGDCSLDVRVPVAISRDLGLHSIVVVPIVTNGRTVGVLEVASCAKAAFTAEQVKGLQKLAKEASPPSTSPLALVRPSISSFGALQQGAISGAAITDSSTSFHRPQEGSIDTVLPKLTSEGAPAVLDHRESTEDLIAKLRAASFREVRQKPRATQPTLFLRDKYTKIARTANSIIASPADFSRKSFVRAGRVARLCSLILIAGAILVGATAGWVLLIVETPADFTVHFAPPPVPRGRVQPMRRLSNPTTSHSADAGKHRNRRVELTEQIAARQLLSSVDPEYPEEGTLRLISGAVSLTVLIDRSGSVQAIEDVSGNRILAAAAERAVRQWQFRRYLLRGQAVETLARVGFMFTLPDGHF